MSVQSPGCPGLCCFCSISPAALRLDGLLAGGASCGFPGGAALGRATGWWCGLWDSRRRCAWTGYWWWCGLWVSRRRCAWPGYWLVVRPVG
ncbi:hypothetical protein MLE23_001374 [Klebsiella aerogenes]|nr:hypothetical protein [Klebsiella aerogenes]